MNDIRFAKCPDIFQLNDSGESIQSFLSGPTVPGPDPLTKKLWRKEGGKWRLKYPTIDPTIGQRGPSALKAVEEELRQDLGCAEAPLVQGGSPRLNTATLPHVI